MDKETEKRLITELSISTDLLIDIKNLTDADKIDTAIKTLEKVEIELT